MVIVLTPNKLHAKISIAAMEAGNHVLVEKPMAIKGREAQMMLDSSIKNNKV